ncbi:sigma 54-interacting transcriptional regulator [Acidithiobacillus sp. HP-6]|uniref:sigma-54 interaction domain-containing protein n=1 Tax=unclassified Acidithiobacillus TaxID=2614800 RepID=UPI00187979D7|nr:MULTISPECIES: sigma 54-interacting transcriptional regulator [unclassified Acidithiobacillus]MBE7563394.1 sigma 54-interacting transcriptional regulator [Acidithiobacillus sp. HP-6]MBE7569607.1 sigma 54-interacting transcriptional regulator [Acidithiobacillus sp. HP-2]
MDMQNRDRTTPDVHKPTQKHKSATGLDVQSVLNIQQNPMVLIDDQYRIIAANRAYQEAYGVQADEIIGRCCHEISHHSPVPCHMRGEDCPHQAVFTTGEAHDVRHIHYDHKNHAEHVRIRGHAIKDQEGNTYLGEEIIRLPHQDEAITCGDMRMVGRSPAFMKCLHHIEMAGRTDATILLYGESGVGKELAASALHQFSARASEAFITVDCASLPETLFESEILGHERGAFTGCLGRKRGLYEMADRGTLFLDEVGELPLSMQAKLLRVLETGSFRRLGGSETLHADVRIIAATNRNLLEMAGQRQFREDLYYRLAAITIDLPPLRDRRDDIAGIAAVLLERIGKSWGGQWTLSKEAERRLFTYDFPGNVRELRNILQKAAALADGPVIQASHLNFTGASPVFAAHAVSSPGAVRDFGTVASVPRGGAQPDDLEALLRQYQGNRRRVAETLGVSERTVYRWLRRDA